MKKNIPFKKTIDLPSSFDKITSINIEHDYKIFDDEITGSFNLYGMLRKTEASLVDENFSKDIPFEIALGPDIDLDTVSLSITDFDYSINEDNTINIDVSMDLEYEEKEDDRKISLDNILDSLDLNEKEDSVIEETNIPTTDIPLVNIAPKEEIKEDIEPDESNVNVISSIIKDKKDYVSYKVYVVNEYEDMTSISNKFNVPINVLLEYNDNKEINIGDKIIIPYVFE